MNKHQNALITVIVPVYKAEQYLCACIDSILKQTYKNLEVILVDDGSPDNCPKICDNYARKDSRVKVIHRKNGGAAAAKNTGLDIAQGEYIGFVDSDDTIHPQMYELLYYYAITDGSDMVTTEWTPSVHKEIYDPLYDGVNRRIFSGWEALERFHQEYYGAIWMSYQTKLFHKNIFEGHRFREGIIFEDTDLLAMTVRRCRKISLIPLKLYYYTLSDGSVMRSEFSPKRYAAIDIWKRYVQMFHEWDLPEQRDLYAMNYLFSLLELYEKTNKQYKEYKEFLAPYLDDFRKQRPWLRKTCRFSRMQRLLLECFPGMPYLAVIIYHLLIR